MERDLWRILSRSISKIAQQFKPTHAYHTHSHATILRIYLWAVLHDRPVSWACHAINWPRDLLPQTLPTQSAMSRRIRMQDFQDSLDALGKALNRQGQAWPLLQVIDGKPLFISKHHQDRDATWGFGAGRVGPGYKIHLLDSGLPMPATFQVQPMNVGEKSVARRLIAESEGSGYVLGDCNYDAPYLYELCANSGRQLIAPRQKPGKGFGHRKQHPDRIRSVHLTEASGRLGQSLGRELSALRKSVERRFAHLGSFGGGLSHLPNWVRGLHRVRLYVHAKLLINAARIINLA